MSFGGLELTEITPVTLLVLTSVTNVTGVTLWPFLKFLFNSLKNFKKHLQRK